MLLSCQTPALDTQRHSPPRAWPARAPHQPHRRPGLCAEPWSPHACAGPGIREQVLPRARCNEDRPGPSGVRMTPRMSQLSPGLEESRLLRCHSPTPSTLLLQNAPRCRHAGHSLPPGPCHHTATKPQHSCAQECCSVTRAGTPREGQSWDTPRPPPRV